MVPAEFWIGVVAGCCGIALVVATVAMLGLLGLRDGFSFELLRRGAWWVAAGLLVASGGCAFAARFPPIPEVEARAAQLELLDHNSPALVAAIGAYERAHGQPPRALDDLAPEFLARVPTTGLRDRPNHDYRPHDRDGWYLGVWIPRFFFDLDGDRRYQYAPDPTKDRELGATLRRGDWVYVPD